MTVNDLCADLEAYLPERWASEAIRALEPAGVERQASGEAPAGELLSIYTVRLTHCREKEINAFGLAELVTWLQSLSPTSEVHVEGFVGQLESVTAFYSPDLKLRACVTVRYDPQSGAEVFGFAMQT